MIDREKLLSISVARARKDADTRERQLDKDLAAYQRLRREGLQPPGVDGSALLESQAVSRAEIETGVVRRDMPLTERRRLARAMSDATGVPE